MGSALLEQDLIATQQDNVLLLHAEQAAKFAAAEVPNLAQQQMDILEHKHATQIVMGGEPAPRLMEMASAAQEKHALILIVKVIKLHAHLGIFVFLVHANH